MGATLADGGVNPLTGERVVDADTCRYTLAVMTTAGLYETSGDWLYDVGLPGKSGIGGGIVTVAPGKGGLGTFAPPLDAAGQQRQGPARRAVPLAAARARHLRLGAGARDAARCRSSSRRSLALACCPAAAADLADETALAERYAPVVRLVEQPEECGHGEPYEPIDVDAALRRADRRAARAVERRPTSSRSAPTADDLAGLYEYHLDFPGQRARPRLRLRALGDRRLREGHDADRLRARRHRPGAPRASSRSSTGSSTSSTTGTTCTRATGR